MKKTIVLLPIAFLLAGCVTNNSSVNSNGENSLTSGTNSLNETVVLDFYNINDFHGAIEENTGLSEPGLSKISTYLKQKKSKNNDGFVLTSSGDMWQGSALSNTFKGAIVNDWMNYMQFDCMTLGNHEFDWGIDTLKSNIKDLNFPVINCNLEDKDLAKPVDWVEGTYTKQVNGLNIGFVGAIGEGQGGDILASVSHSFNFPDPSSYVIDAATELREKGADIIVYLLHDETAAVNSQVVDKVDVIFCGHSHQGERQLVNGKPLLQAYSNGKDLAHINLTYNKTTKSIQYNTYEIIDLRNMQLAKDAGAEEIIGKRYDDATKTKLEAEIGRTNRQLSQSDLTSLITKYFYQYYCDNYTEYPIYAANHNNARSAIARGVVTYKDAFKAFPFENEPVLMKIKGSALKTITYGQFYPNKDDNIADNEYYYIFTIDYIADYDYYYQPSLGVEIVERYKDIYPRDIFSQYFGADYPL